MGQYVQQFVCKHSALPPLSSTTIGSVFAITVVLFILYKYVVYSQCRTRPPTGDFSNFSVTSSPLNHRVFHLTQIQRKSYTYLAFLCSCFIIPFRVSFRESWKDVRLTYLWYTLDYTGDVLFLLDIYLNFRCAVMVDGIEVHEVQTIGEQSFSRIEILSPRRTSHVARHHRSPS